LVGVGVGPGDPELMTTRALRVLRQADRVFAPATAVDAVGRAESIVRQSCPDVVVERLPFEMGCSPAARAGALDAAAARLVDCVDAGERVAFITLGDPNIYSTFSVVAEAVRARRPDVAVETVPGVMAFQDLAARTGAVLTSGTEQLSLVTALDGADALDPVVEARDAALVVYKGGRHLPEIAKRLADAGRLDGAVAGELLGLPGERVSSVSDIAGGPASYLVTVIVPPASRVPTGPPDKEERR
jgi:precorrin-2/cobalt-factor-2 C20-methyltransferase